MSKNTDSQPGAGPLPGLGQDFTDRVIRAMGPQTSPRLRTVMAALVQHMHDFAREVRLTTDEWALGVALINAAGQMSSATRNEGQLLCDVLGLESLVDGITYDAVQAEGAATQAQPAPTVSSVLGPFWRSDTPTRPNGTTISLAKPADMYMHGRVSSSGGGGGGGAALAGAVVDVWQASTNGLYEQQDAAQPEHNLRGKFVTDADGRYSFYCLRPTPYPIPDDGPAGALLKLLDRHPWRPAHIHLMVTAEGHKPVTTQIFDADSQYIDDDAVFAVKDGLLVRFQPRAGDAAAALELEYDIVLAREEAGAN